MNMHTANQIPKTKALPFIIMRVDDRRRERCSHASKPDISTYEERKHKKVVCCHYVAVITLSLVLVQLKTIFKPGLKPGET